MRDAFKVIGDINVSGNKKLKSLGNLTSVGGKVYL
jgi:hypothetical protein